MLKKTLFILLSSTIFSVHATPDFLSYKNCSPLNLSDANFSLSSKDVFLNIHTSLKIITF